MENTLLSSGNEKSKGEENGKHAHLVVNDGIGEAGCAKQRIGERVAEQRSIGEGRDKNEDAQSCTFEPDEFPDGKGNSRSGEHHYPGDDRNVEMGFSQVKVADGHEGQAWQRERNNIAYQVGQMFFFDHSDAAENQGKAENAGYEEYFVHGVPEYCLFVGMQTRFRLCNTSCEMPVSAVHEPFRYE